MLPFAEKIMLRNYELHDPAAENDRAYQEIQDFISLMAVQSDNDTLRKRLPTQYR